MASLRLDLHVHTFASGDSTSLPDALFNQADVASIDVFAVTDHHTLRAAISMAARAPLQVIVGEEIATDKGDLIGLFLSERIPQGLTISSAIELIRHQGGLTCIPHPGDANRRSVSLETTHDLALAGGVDLIEWGNSKRPAPIGDLRSLCDEFPASFVASSDSHVEAALGSSYTEISANLPLTAKSLLDSLRGARLVHRYCDPIRNWAPRVVPSSPDCLS